ncbi:MAG: hypothetical protein ACPGXK_15170, partial [Phycisphaerae bacterium]
FEKNPGRFSERANRERYNPQVPVRIEVYHIGGTTSRYQVQAFDLSESGIGFFHGGFVYPDSVCDVHLVTPDREFFTVTATITRCLWVDGSIHFVAAEFKQPIEIGEFFAESKPAAVEAQHPVATAVASVAATPVTSVVNEKQVISRELLKLLSNHLAVLSHHPALWHDVRYIMDDLDNMIAGRETRLPIEFYSTQDHVALVDDAGLIRYVNPAWCYFAANNGYEGKGFTGSRYLDVLNGGDGTDPSELGIKAVLRGEVPEYVATYTCHNESDKLWYKLLAREYSVSPGYAIEHQLVARTPKKSNASKT